jgi:hypothetical protein
VLHQAVAILLFNDENRCRQRLTNSSSFDSVEPPMGGVAPEVRDVRPCFSRLTG